MYIISSSVKPAFVPTNGTVANVLVVPSTSVVNVILPKSVACEASQKTLNEIAPTTSSPKTSSMSLASNSNVVAGVLEPYDNVKCSLSMATERLVRFTTVKFKSLPTVTSPTYLFASVSSNSSGLGIALWSLRIFTLVICTTSALVPTYVTLT